MSKNRDRLVFPVMLVVLAGTVAAGLYVSRSHQREAAYLASERTHAVQQQMTALGRVATAEYLYRNVIYAARDRSFGPVRTGSTEVLFAIGIRVQAGIDLEAGYRVDVERSDPGRAFVTLPDPQVFFVDADETTIEEYFSEERLMRLNWLDVGNELEVQKATARDDAIERGLLTRARANAVDIFEEMFAIAGFREVDIRFTPSGELRG